MRVIYILIISSTLLFSNSMEDTLAIDKNQTKESSKLLNIEPEQIKGSFMMKKERIYHAKNVQHSIFEKGGDGFLIFIGKGNYYNLLTDGFSSFSLKELKIIIQKDKNNKNKFLLKKGAYSFDKGTYRASNGDFYTFFERKKIEVITVYHIKFDGYDYYLEE